MVIYRGIEAIILSYMYGDPVYTVNIVYERYWGYICVLGLGVTAKAI
jgi:hypothetical protein